MAEELKPRLINPADTGGLPVFNDDIIQAQDNNRNTTKEQLEFLRSGINENTGKISFQDSPTPTFVTRDVGLILSGCVIDKTGIAPYPVSEGYVYIDGEVLKFPGTTILDNQFVEMKKGSVTNVQRTFKDGSPKDATEKFALDFQVGTQTAFWTPSFSGVQIILVAPGYSEMQTIQGGQSLINQSGVSGFNHTGLLVNYDNPEMNVATLESYVTGAAYSRIKEIHESQASLSINIDTTTFDDAVLEFNVCFLASWNKTTTERRTVILKDSGGVDAAVQIAISPSGQVTVRRPLGETTWVTISGGAVYIIDITISAISPTAIFRPYSGYDTNFMTKS